MEIHSRVLQDIFPSTLALGPLPKRRTLRVLEGAARVSSGLGIKTGSEEGSLIPMPPGYIYLKVVMGP